MLAMSDAFMMLIIIITFPLNKHVFQESKNASWRLMMFSCTNHLFFPHFSIALQVFCLGVGLLEAKIWHEFESCIIYALSALACSSCNRFSPVNKHIDVLPPSKRLNQSHHWLYIVPMKIITFLFKVYFTTLSIDRN